MLCLRMVSLENPYDAVLFGVGDGFLVESSARLVKALIFCRFRDKVTAVLPCNCVANGFCGVDAGKCDIVVLERVS